jgi:tRNA nucleotidyltransferase (CCA-adding enzyme)
VQIAATDELLQRALACPPLAVAANAASALGVQVYLVGGTARDLLLGRDFLDVDLAVEGDPAPLAARIGQRDVSPTRFGTLSVRRHGWRYDLARTRAETYARPGALPDVMPAGIETDLRRRDFTVNAIAFGLAGARTGELLAPPGALADLAHRRLAVLHDRSFSDDPTRLLRLARYCARLGFGPGPETRALAGAAIAARALDTVSGTRLGNELRLLAHEADPVAGFRAAAALGLPWGIDVDLAGEALGVLPEDGRADLLVLACVFATMDAGALGPELERLGFTAPERDTVAEAATGADPLARRLQQAGSATEIARAIGRASLETVALASGRGARPQARVWLQDLRHRRLAITGGDLIAAGLSEGPEVGRALDRATDALMEGSAPDRDSQLRVALGRDE